MRCLDLADGLSEVIGPAAFSLGQSVGWRVGTAISSFRFSLRWGQFGLLQIRYLQDFHVLQLL